MSQIDCDGGHTANVICWSFGWNGFIENLPPLFAFGFAWIHSSLALGEFFKAVEPQPGQFGQLCEELRIRFAEIKAGFPLFSLVEFS